MYDSEIINRTNVNYKINIKGPRPKVNHEQTSKQTNQHQPLIIIDP